MHKEVEKKENISLKCIWLEDTNKRMDSEKYIKTENI